MEYLVFALVIFLFIVLIMLKGLWDEKQKKKKFIIWLQDNYGVLPEREEYKSEELYKISRYFEVHRQEGFNIDDITWNDLNMDAIFTQMNYTFSAAGEEYLYYLLRTPMQSVQTVKTLEKHISFFAENKEERIKYQTFFAELGKTGKYSIYDYIEYLDGLGIRSNRMHYFSNGILLVSFAILFVNMPLAILLMFVVLTRNIVSYFKEKNEIDPYVISFGYILRLIRSAEKIGKMPADVLAAELGELEACRKKMGRFKAGSGIIMSSTKMNASGNPLEILLDYVRMVLHLDLIKFNNMLAEVRKNTDTIDRMITIMGYIEATIAVGAYRVSKECYCLPEFNNGKSIYIENVYHPLISEPVKNTIDTEKGVLLTGSNASGKSTFLKTIAINTILAQTIHTCLADNYHGGLYRIMSSMSLRDDLSGGDSYYIVEIKSLKRILNAASQDGNPVLCFVDEVLRGTNTVERIAASTQILQSLAKPNVICFAATHDIELTHLLEKSYNNYHFEEEILENDVAFNYRLMKGRATTRNAIKLLKVIGYEESIIQEAEKLAESFTVTGSWTVWE